MSKKIRVKFEGQLSDTIKVEIDDVAECLEKDVRRIKRRDIAQYACEYLCEQFDFMQGLNILKDSEYYEFDGEDKDNGIWDVSVTYDVVTDQIIKLSDKDVYQILEMEECNLADYHYEEAAKIKSLEYFTGYKELEIDEYPKMCEMFVKPEGFPWDKESYLKFVQDVEDAGYEWREYQGRYYYNGPGVVVSSTCELDDVTSVSLQWDNMGLDYIVYPR